MQVIVKPILSEKMTALTDKQNRVAFVVSKAANKFEIKRAVETMYSVTVKSVNTMVYQGDAKSSLHESRCYFRKNRFLQESNCDLSRR